ncbi:TatD family hydrolase [Capnocytophaga cynodegmi]|uniref:TatD family hydrolase n=1 Tax=Capnocytophaga cynodegmi TaxID=28189 RepID=UPI00385F69AA
MKFLDIHSHKQKSSPDTIVIRNEYPFTADTTDLFSVGIHPWYLEDWNEQWNILVNVAEHPNCVAIGECGLDKNISESLELQKIIFEKHIELSESLKKPLIIHCVKSYSELISCKKKFRPRQMWILHGFNKNQSVCDMLLREGIYLSFGKELLTNEKLQNVFKKIPQGSYFFETDNSDIDISEIYHKARELKGEIEIFTEKLFYSID